MDSSVNFSSFEQQLQYLSNQISDIEASSHKYFKVNDKGSYDPISVIRRTFWRPSNDKIVDKELAIKNLKTKLQGLIRQQIESDTSVAVTILGTTYNNIQRETLCIEDLTPEQIMRFSGFHELSNKEGCKIIGRFEKGLMFEGKIFFPNPKESKKFLKNMSLEFKSESGFDLDFTGTGMLTQVLKMEESDHEIIVLERYEGDFIKGDLEGKNGVSTLMKSDWKEENGNIVYRYKMVIHKGEFKGGKAEGEGVHIIYTDTLEEFEGNQIYALRTAGEWNNNELIKVLYQEYGVTEGDEEFLRSSAEKTGKIPQPSHWMTIEKNQSLASHLTDELDF